MGLFRTVEAELACGRCGVIRMVEVQFKTGDDGLEHYRAGELVREDDHFHRPNEFRGIGDRYCDACYRDFAVDEALSKSDVVARLIHDGRLTLQPAGANAPLTAEEAREDGHRHAEELRSSARQGGPYVIRFGMRGDVQTWDGVSASPYGEAWREMTRTLHEFEHAAMRSRGWSTGDERFREDLVVYLDPVCRIYVRVGAFSTGEGLRIEAEPTSGER